MMAMLGYFSTQPRLVLLGDDQALLRLSFSHAAQRLQECRQRSAEELAKLPPNMRAAQDCPRERSPVTVELELDGKLLFRVVASPTGLSKDGASTVYRRLPVAAGRHRLVARLSDTATGSFNHFGEVTVDLGPGDALVVDFNAGKGGFQFRT
jgi:hypothetical protein